MKNIFKLILTLVLFTTFSCTSDNEETTGQDKTSLILDISQNTSSKTAKDVKRGNVYAWVKDITLTATSIETGWQATELFRFVDDNSQTGTTAGVYRLDDVAIGRNNIKATSTTNTTPELTLTAKTGNPKDATTLAIKKNPYAVYESAVLVEDIQRTPNNVIKVPMNTNNGRIIGTFTVEDNSYLTNNFVIKLEAFKTINGVKTSIGHGEVTKTQSIQLYWSDDKCVEGNKITYVVSFLSKVNNVVMHTVTEEVGVKASTSYSCTYTIKTPKDIFKDDNKFDFVFQKWVEETCNTCK